MTVIRRKARFRTTEATSSPLVRTRTSRYRIDASVVDGQSVITNVRIPDAAPLDFSAANLIRTAQFHEIVNACLKVRADSLIAPVLTVERRQPDGTYVAEPEHPLIGLFRVPGETLDTATLWRCLSVSWDAVGVCYLEPLYTTGGMLAGLNPLNPVHVSEHVNPEGMLDYYEWWPGYGERVQFPPDELIVRRTVQWADMPPLVSALASVDADWSMTDYVRAFFGNAGIPSGILKIDAEISQEFADDTRQKWVDRFGRYGTAVAGPAVFGRGTSYDRVGAQMDELESESLRSIAESRITMCFGVPPLIIYAFVGLLRATYSNLTEAWASFWDSTATPLLVEWAGWLTRTVLAAYEDQADIRMGNVRVTFNKAGLGPYIEDATAKVGELRAGMAAGAVTVNEYRTAIGLDARADGDVYLRNPTSQVPDEASKARRLPPRYKPDAVYRAELAAMPRLIPPPRPEVKAGPVPSKRLDRDVEKYLRDEYAKARRLWVDGNGQGSQSVLLSIEDQLDDGTGLFGILAPSQRKAYADAWRAAAAQVNADVVIDTGDVTTAVDTLARRCEGITETTRQEIADIITRGATDQLTDSEITRQLADLGISRASIRAPVITRSELATAAHVASVAAYTASGVVDSLTWLVGPDPCPECQELEGKSFSLESVASGDAPQVPNHPACRCDYAPNVTSEVAA